MEIIRAGPPAVVGGLGAVQLGVRAQRIQLGPGEVVADSQAEGRVRRVPALGEQVGGGGSGAGMELAGPDAGPGRKRGRLRGNQLARGRDRDRILGMARRGAEVARCPGPFGQIDQRDGELGESVPVPEVLGRLGELRSGGCRLPVGQGKPAQQPDAPGEMPLAAHLLGELPVPLGQRPGRPGPAGPGQPFRPLDSGHRMQVPGRAGEHGPVGAEEAAFRLLAGAADIGHPAHVGERVEHIRLGGPLGEGHRLGGGLPRLRGMPERPEAPGQVLQADAQARRVGVVTIVLDA